MVMTPAFLDLLRLHVSAEAYRQLPPDDLWAKVRDALDEIAFRVLLERIGSRVYQRCRAILRDDYLAEEAFQDTFRDLIRKRASIPSYQSAAAWAYQTATNHSRHLRRKGWLWRTRERGRPVEPAEQSAPQADHADEVDRLLAALPDRYRRPIELVYWQGLTHAEAAAALGWPKGTVDSYVAQGLKRLRAESLKLGLPALTLGVILARPANAVSEAVLSHLAQTSWAAGCVPELAGPWWLSWKTLAAGVLGAGLLAGGLVIALRPVAAPPVVTPSTSPAKSTTAVPETLQAKNLRIAREEIAGPVRDILQKYYPDNPILIDAVRAVGSEVEIEYRTTRPPTLRTAAARFRFRYCLLRRSVDGRSQPHGETRWYWINPAKPLALTIGIPFGKPLEVVRGQEESATVEQLFEKLTPDDRAESEQIRALFGSPDGELLLPSDTLGVSGFPGGLALSSATGGLFIRDSAGHWSYAGKCPGWFPVVVDDQVYCYRDAAIWSRSRFNPSASWVKWSDEPTVQPGTPQRTGILFVADRRIYVAVQPNHHFSRPLADRSIEWERSEAPLDHEGLAAIGPTLFGNDGTRLFARPVADRHAAWVPVGPWPQGCRTLIADGDRLLAFGGLGPIYARAATAGPTDPWTIVGRVYDPHLR